MNYTLLTNIAQAHHLAILDDWLEFLAVPPAAISAVLPDNPDVEAQVVDFCRARGITFVPTEIKFDRAAMQNETPLLLEQIGTTKTEWAMVVRLDTFPFRSRHKDWLQVAEQALRDNAAPFLTGATRLYRADQPTDNPNIVRTQRISNNFVFIKPDFWLEVIKNARDTKDLQENIFFAEAAVETHCSTMNVWGLRWLNTPDWRVFHTQLWGPDQAEARKSYRKGYRIAEYMWGVEDDQRHPWTRYYLSPKPSLVKRARIYLGRIRREFSDSLFSKRA